MLDGAGGGAGCMLFELSCGGSAHNADSPPAGGWLCGLPHAEASASSLPSTLTRLMYVRDTPT